MVPTVVNDDDPAKGDAPTLLYDIVLATVPSKLTPELAPVPALLKVNAFEIEEGIEIFDEPSKLIPLIVTGDANFVAVAALPVIFPVTLEPLTASILASVTLASANLEVLIAASFIFAVVIALFEIRGEAAVPLKSPDKANFPLVVASASAIVEIAICPST